MIWTLDGRGVAWAISLEAMLGEEPGGRMGEFSMQASNDLMTASQGVISLQPINSHVVLLEL
jgi:hypothetical protein